jgi:uncharacterized OB-fold protein
MRGDGCREPAPIAVVEVEGKSVRRLAMEGQKDRPTRMELEAEVRKKWSPVA